MELTKEEEDLLKKKADEILSNNPDISEDDFLKRMGLSDKVMKVLKIIHENSEGLTEEEKKEKNEILDMCFFAKDLKKKFKKGESSE